MYKKREDQPIRYLDGCRYDRVEVATNKYTQQSYNNCLTLLTQKKPKQS